MNAPYILDETDDFAVVFKPPRMHCAPLRSGGGPTLLDWYAAAFPPVKGLRGRQEREGGLPHRLDFETCGLVLFAKRQEALDFLLERQAAGDFVKEYGAVCRKAASPAPSFPPSPVDFPPPRFPAGGLVAESFFRPFGPGRKQVRPVTGVSRGEIAKDQGGPYRTEIAGVSGRDPARGFFRVTARLRRGFRHQVRCHLAWLGCPILNDPVYGTYAPDGTGDFLALRAEGIFFPDPSDGRLREYRIAPLELPVNSM